MKQYTFLAAIFITALLLSTNSPAQKPGNRDKKTKEIIIRKNGDKTTKMTIEIDGDNITVNGKPLSDYHGDDISVIKRDFMRDHSRNFLWSPGNNEDMEINDFDNDMEFNNDDIRSEASRPFLGVKTEKAVDGVKITSVIKGSSAEKAGLLKDDIITRLNDKKINSPEDLMDVVKSYKPEDNVKIDYLRNNKKEDVKVKLGETKDKKGKFFFKDFGHNMNGDGFNFKMPPMPKMSNLPNMYYNYNLGNKNHPKLGLKVEDSENGGGAKILSVEDGPPAAKAGLKKDDLITEINGEKVDNVEEIREQLNEDDKESLNVKAKRNNTEMSFELKIPRQLNSADL